MEEEFLSSPTTVVQEPAGPEPIEVDAVEIELHPSWAEELIADADRFKQLTSGKCPDT